MKNGDIPDQCIKHGYKMKIQDRCKTSKYILLILILLLIFSGSSFIISQFLIETLVLSIVSGIIGISLGILIPLLITYFAGMPTVITSGSILLSLFISISIGTIFGLYPAVRAANVDPIVALRHE